MPSLVIDQRRCLDGKPLRQSRRVEYLDQQHHKKSSTGQIDCIYDAQLSVLVTGLDDWFWTAYSFVDTYFKGSSHSEGVEHYYENVTDPHSCGTHPPDRPFWLPRDQFLMMLACRIDQIKQEWNNAVLGLLQQIEPYTDMMSLDDTVKQHAKQEITQQPGYKWTIRTLRRFTNQLTKTITPGKDSLTEKLGASVHQILRTWLNHPGLHTLLQLRKISENLTTCEVRCNIRRKCLKF